MAGWSGILRGHVSRVHVLLRVGRGVAERRGAAQLSRGVLKQRFMEYFKIVLAFCPLKYNPSIG